jgi:hypothetical protein
MNLLIAFNFFKMKILEKKKLKHLVGGGGTCFNPETVWDNATQSCVERKQML